MFHSLDAFEAVIPHDLSGLVKQKTALLAAPVFKLPRAHWTPINAVLLVMNDLESEWPRVHATGAPWRLSP
jgi:hypothetical protein